ncbi:MAG: ATP-grasp domain-containing protein [Gemmatimonadaceae bacterium]|nr:ATP-grasp domain-containing protein [Gemmatimonadaceae bacterium]
MLVVFVAPLFSPAASQMIEAAVSLPGVRLAVVTQEPLERLAPDVADRLVGHWRIDNVLHEPSLEGAIRALAAMHGTVDRCFGALEQLQQPLAAVRERLGITGMSSSAASNFREKGRMKDVLRSAGVPVARHAMIGTRGDAAAFVREVGYPIVIKPPAGAGALATARIADDQALDRFLAAHAPRPDDPMLAEEFLRGTEHSLETVSINGQAVWHSLTHYYPTPLQVLENPWIQWGVVLPREVDDAAYDDIRAIGARALQALGMRTGVSHCEWFRRQDGSVAISEIAARPPGAHITTMISRANDMDFVKAWVALMVFGAFEPPMRRYAVGTAYLRGQGTGRVQRVEGLEEVRREFGALVCDIRVPARGHAPTGSYEGEGYIIVRHPETAVVQQAVQRIVSLVRVHLG